MPTTENLAKEHAPQITQAIQTAARGNPTEAQFRKPVEEVLAGFAERARVPLRPHHEYSVATGRADTVYNRLIIEYKRPGHLSGGPSRNNTAAVEQTKRYIEDIERQQRIRKARLVGVVTDGGWMIYCRHIDGRWRQESPVAVDVDSVGRLLTLLDRLLAGTVAEADLAPVELDEWLRVPGGVEDDEEELLLQSCNAWVVVEGLPVGELAYELADAEGEPMAILDLAWPRGLQKGLSQPVALLIDEGHEVAMAANRAGYPYFTDVDVFRNYVRREILSADDNGDG